MKKLLFPIALVALAATSTSPGRAADDAMDGFSKVYTLAAQNGSGETGTVALVSHGPKTVVIVSLVGAPAGIPQPAHVHPGSCSKLDPTPKYPLDSAKDGVSMTTLDVPIKTLTAGGFAVNVHKSADDLKTYVACGDLAS